MLGSVLLSGRNGGKCFPELKKQPNLNQNQDQKVVHIPERLLNVFVKPKLDTLEFQMS